MCVSRDPYGQPCPHCGQRDTLTFHASGFIRSVVRHKCPAYDKRWPPAPPVVLPDGAEMPADDYPKGPTT